MRHLKSPGTRVCGADMFTEYHIFTADRFATVSHPLSVADAAVVAVVRLEVWVSSVPPGVHVTLRSGVSQEAVCFCRVDTDGHHLCQERR